MGTESIQVSAVIPASPERVYAAWLDGAAHGAMTGGKAEIDARVGGRHSAWDGYISGETRELEEGRRIVQSWRSAEFPSDSPDSQIVVSLIPEGDHTRITIDHTEIPEGQGEGYKSGWHEHYFAPMTAYFRGPMTEGEDAAPAAPAKKAAAKRAPAKKAAPKKAAPKKAAPKKAAPKKAAARKAAPKKAAKKAVKAVKKAAARKKAAPKKVAKKAVKKAAARKKAAGKAAPKKATKKAAKKKAPAKRR